MFRKFRHAGSGNPVCKAGQVFDRLAARENKHIAGLRAGDVS